MGSRTDKQIANFAMVLGALVLGAMPARAASVGVLPSRAMDPNDPLATGDQAAPSPPVESGVAGSAAPSQPVPTINVAPPHSGDAAGTAGQLDPAPAAAPSFEPSAPPPTETAPSLGTYPSPEVAPLSSDPAQASPDGGPQPPIAGTGPADSTLAADSGLTALPTSEERRHLWAFLGIDGGYAVVTSTVPGEITRSGTQFGLKGVASYYFDHPWVIDLGGGWERTQVEGTSVYNLGYTQTSGLVTRAGFAEAQFRARLGDHFQIGPYLQMMFGTDLSFSPYFNPFISSTPLIGGAQALYEITPESSSWATRIGAKLGAGLTIPDREFYSAQLTLSFGLPLSPAHHPAEVTRALPPVPAYVSDPIAPAPPPAPLPPPEAPAALAPAVPASPADTVIVKAMEMSVEVTVGGNFVNFQTGKSNITPRFGQYLDDLSLALRETKDSWKTVEIQGHTDIRGGHEYNMRLSAARAKSAAHALAARGISSKKIITKHFGPDRPLDKGNDARAWAINRRVEVRILGVSNSEALAERLRQIPIAGPSGAPDPVRVSMTRASLTEPIHSKMKARKKKKRKKKKPAQHAPAAPTGTSDT